MDVILLPSPALHLRVRVLATNSLFRNFRQCLPDRIKIQYCILHWLMLKLMLVFHWVCFTLLWRQTKTSPLDLVTSSNGNVALRRHVLMLMLMLIDIRSMLTMFITFRIHGWRRHMVVRWCIHFALSDLFMLNLKALVANLLLRFDCIELT
jgi:hypothetical protein